MKDKRGSLLIISGASGVGKSTVIAEVLKARPNIYFSVSWTTRPPRTGEVDGVDYHFTDRDGFNERIQAGDFLEYAEYVGNYYGTSKSIVESHLEQGEDVLLDIEVQGAAQIRRNSPEATMVFMIPPSYEVLEARLRARGSDSERKVQGRLDRAREEMRDLSDYDYIVVNDKVEHAAEEIMAIFTAERCRKERRIHLTNW